MSSEDNKKIIERFATVWGDGSPDMIDELAVADIVVAYPLFPEPVRGRDAFKAFLASVHRIYPDVRLIIHELIAENDKVVVRWTQRGTHKGELLNIPAT